MLNRLLKIKSPLWGAGLIVLMTWVEEAEAQPPPDPSVVEGTVLGPEGPLPAESATVTLYQVGQGGQLEEQLLQQNGTFLFPKVPLGTYELRVQAEGFAERFLRNLQIGDGRKYHWELKVVPPKIMKGRIFRPDGSPLANTQVEFRCGWRIDSFIDPKYQGTTTNGEGRYEIQIEEGVGFLAQVLLVHPGQIFPGGRSAGEGYACSPFRPFASGQAPLELDFRLRPGYTLTGTIRDAETHASIPALGLSLKPAALLDLPGFEVPIFRNTTNADGVFTFQNLPPGIYELTAGRFIPCQLGLKTHKNPVSTRERALPLGKSI